MRVAVISHLGGLERWSSRTNFQMALAHLVLESDRYATWFRTQALLGCYVVVDNGMLEGATLSMEEILRAAALVGASEIVLPDVLGDCVATMMATQWALREIPPTLRLQKMGVPQGETPERWLECYRAMCDTPNIDVIGIAGITDELFQNHGGRMGLCLALSTLGLVRTGTPYHLLGMKSDPREVESYAACFPWIRSIDSQLPVLCGQLGVRFPYMPDDGEWARPDGCLDYLSKEVTNERLTDLNVETWLAWAGEGARGELHDMST